MKTRKFIIALLTTLTLSLGGYAAYDYYQRGQKTLKYVSYISAHPIEYDYPHTYGMVFNLITMASDAIKRDRPLYGARERIALDYAEELQQLAQDIADLDRRLSPHDYDAASESEQFKSYERRKGMYAEEIGLIRVKGKKLNARAKELEMLFR